MTKRGGEKNMTKKYLIVGAMALLALFGITSFASAAADPDLTTAIASSTSFFSDNLAVMVNFIVEIVLKLAGVSLAFGAVYWIYRKIRSIFRSN